MLAEGSNTSPVGTLRAVRYRLEELSLNVPVKVDIRGRNVEVDKAWRLNDYRRPFHSPRTPSRIWIDEVALGVGQESEQLDRISVVTFDRSALREGATISLSYGTSFEDRTELPEKLSPGWNQVKEEGDEETTRIQISCVLASVVLLNASLIEVARAQTPDPGIPGSLAVTGEEYNLWQYCIYSDRLSWLRSSCWRRCTIRRG